MKQTHKKVPCSICKREFDVRGIVAHENTHNTKNVEHETPDMKRGPVSVSVSDWDSFRAGVRFGQELEREKVA